MKRLLHMAACCLVLTACGSSSNDRDTANPSSDVAAQAATEAADGAGNASRAVADDGAQGVKGMASNFNTTFDFDGCTCAVNGSFAVASGAVTLDANVVADPTSCSKGRVIKGSEHINASITNTRRAMQIDADLSVTLRSGDVVRIASLTPGTPTYEGVGTGAPSSGTTTFTASINEHRQQRTAGNDAMYDLNVTTVNDTPLTIIDTYTQSQLTQRTLNGAVSVHHNLAKYVATHTFKNVQRTFAACTCPSAGELDQKVTLDDDAAEGGSYIKVYTFTGCGMGTFTAQNGATSLVATNGAATSGTFSWDSCD